MTGSSPRTIPRFAIWWEDTSRPRRAPFEPFGFGWHERFDYADGPLAGNGGWLTSLAFFSGSLPIIDGVVRETNPVETGDWNVSKVAGWTPNGSWEFLLTIDSLQGDTGNGFIDVVFGSLDVSLPKLIIKNKSLSSGGGWEILVHWGALFIGGTAAYVPGASPVIRVSKVGTIVKVYFDAVLLGTDNVVAQPPIANPRIWLFVINDIDYVSQPGQIIHDLRMFNTA